MAQIDVEGIVQRIRRWLPLQNPLGRYIHNNPLQEWEGLPYEEAILRAGLLYRARPYLRLREFERILKVKTETQEVNFSQWYWNHSMRGVSRLDRFARQDFEKSQQDFLIPLVSTFLDQGMAHWQNPFVERGLFEYFRFKVLNGSEWNRENSELKRILLEQAQWGAKEWIARELDECGISEDRWEDYLLEVAFLLKGWSGAVSRLEIHEDLRWQGKKFARLVDWLAILLLVERVWNERFSVSPRISEFSFGKIDEAPWSEHRKLQDALNETNVSHWRSLLTTNPKMDSSPTEGTRDTGYQVLFCMDDREESLRRHLESVSPEVETFGTVGFFGIDMLYHALDAAVPVALCPPVIEPTKTVFEYSDVRTGTFFAKERRSFALWSFHYSRSLVRGAVLTIVMGIAGSLPFWFKLFFPLRVKRIAEFFSLERFRRVPTQINFESAQGYSIVEQANLIEKILRSCGLDRNFRDVVVVLAHGATSANNPFRQAYGCGACSGNAGKPNARIFCEMANRSEVRKILDSRGVLIPEKTIFLPACHDTTTDEIEWLPTRTPVSGQVMDRISSYFEKALDLNAQERVKWFGSFRESRRQDTRRTRAHVSDRALDLAQPRPEYGHCRVACCIVAHRELTRGKNLDRRSFLVSYDHRRDESGKWLKEAMYGTVPVAANIIHDYNVSRLDPERFGAGSKLPLNLTGFLGVMTGSKSDLRLGLPTQTTEIHIPLRPMICVEAEEEALHLAIADHARLKRMTENGWIDVYRIDPKSHRFSKVEV